MHLIFKKGFVLASSGIFICSKGPFFSCSCSWHFWLYVEVALQAAVFSLGSNSAQCSKIVPCGRACNASASSMLVCVNWLAHTHVPAMPRVIIHRTHTAYCFIKCRVHCCRFAITKMPSCSHNCYYT